jgi:hypothetical protein
MCRLGDPVPVKAETLRVSALPVSPDQARGILEV